MPSRKRTSSVLSRAEDSGELGDRPEEVEQVTNADDALAAAEEAEAEAVEAEAVAAAARARARAIRLRREAAAAAAASVDESAADEATTVIEPDVAEDTVVDEPPVFTSTDESDADTAPAEAEATEVGAEDDDDDDDDEEQARPRRRLRVSARVWKYVAAGVVVICALALVTVSALMYLHHRNVEAQHQRSAEFAAAARQGVVTLMSLDFNNAKDDVQRILENTTGDFRKDFEGQAEDFIRVAQESKVVTEATVNAVAVQRMDDNTATVLVAVLTRVSNAASDKQDPRSWRLAVDVARDGDQIKLAKVEFVP